MMGRGGVMVTSRFCGARLRVRFPASHPGHRFFCAVTVVLIALLAVAAAEPAVGIDVGYLVRDDVTVYDIVSSESGTSEVTPYVTTHYYSPFGRKFGWDENTQMVTSIAGLPNNLWKQFTDADKGLAGVLLEMMVRAEQAVDAVPNTVIGSLDDWRNDIRPAYWIGAGLDVTGVRVPDLLATITQNQSSTYNRFNELLIPLSVLPANQEKAYSQSETLFRNSKYPLELISGGYYGTGIGIADMFAAFSKSFTFWYSMQRSWLTAGNNYGPVLWSDGQLHDAPADLSLTSLSAQGFMGLAQLLAGDSGKRTIDIIHLDPDNPLSTGVMTVHTSLFSAFGDWASSGLNALTKLQFVLANDSDIKLKQDEKENQDAVEDKFFGDGEAAVKPSDITDAADLAGDVKDAFQGAGSPGDAFVSINDATNYSFFSQEVSDSLDTVGKPALQSDDDFMSAFQADQNGFYSLADPSFFSLEDYLRGKSN